MRRYFVVWVTTLLLLGSAVATPPVAAQVVGTRVPVENGPQAVVADPVSWRVYVANRRSQSISVIDAISNAVVATIRVAGVPNRMALNPVTRRLYVLHEGFNTISVIDGSQLLLETVIALGENPVAVAVNPVTNRVYVATSTTGQVLVIDGASDRVEGSLTVGSTPREVVVNPVTNQLQILTADGTRSLIDTARNLVLDTARPTDAGGISSAALNPSNNRLYLTQLEKNSLAILDGASGRLLERVTIPAPDAVAVNPTNNRVFVVSGASGTLTILDGGNNQIVTTLPVGGKGRGVAVNPATGRAYVTLEDWSAVAVVGFDFTAPVVDAVVVPEPNAAGWNNTDVTVSLRATDESNGSGIKQFRVATTGAEVSAPATAEIAEPSVKITRDGATTVLFRALDGEGNASTEQSVTLHLDKTAPRATVAADDGAWHTGDVALPVTVDDFGSGLLRAEDAAFSLIARVAEGEESADVSTDSRPVEDVAGNRITVGPVKGIKIDRKAPTLAFPPPSQRVYLLRQPVAAEITCTDGGSGVASCVATGLQNGSLDTGAVGTHAFGVTASDKVGNQASASVSYTVAYDVRLAYDPKAAVRRGKDVSIQLQVQDATGENLSSPALLLTAQRIDPVPSNGTPPVTLGRPFTFRRASGSKSRYTLTVSTKNLAPGQYVVSFTAGREPYVYTAPFTVR